MKGVGKSSFLAITYPVIIGAVDGDSNSAVPLPYALSKLPLAISKRSVNHFRTDEYPANAVFLACGMADPVFGGPVMRGLAKQFKNGCVCTELPEAGHFVQEWGDKVARNAFEVFVGENTKEGLTVVQPRDANL
ncbi:hypothetical protein BC936DRAFT_139253 [Jimgerdemannia flammicorona]|uniref:Alpha/Beta hydrolase protein n=1 Tax=Jimgerdemannia flammicorona TaxID=994334 RepID=A0A433BA98_9FUNG|nr:hypothetical protein BC936DRAFT_139253 [Jimgerdemannia flammicorona]